MSDKIKFANQNSIRWERALAVAAMILVPAAILIVVLLDQSGQGKVQALVERVDDRQLELQVLNPVRETLNPYSEVTVIANKDITVDSTRASMQKIGEIDGSKYYVVRVSKLPVGPTEVTLRFFDAAGTEKVEKLTITRIDFAFPAGFTEVGPWEDSEYILDGDSLAANVSKKARLFEDYEPSDLIDLNKDLGLYTLNNAQLRREAAAALKLMLSDLAKDTGKYVTVASGYRSYQTQARTYANWVKELGVAGADAVSARPGHSEHQLGTTVDFVSEDTAWKISGDFGTTVAGAWLAENCEKYGFIIPYNEDRSADGGYKEESWHFRFVGVEQSG